MVWLLLLLRLLVRGPLIDHPPTHPSTPTHPHTHILSLQVTAATLFPRPLSRITEPAGHIAVVLMNLFFSVRPFTLLPLSFPCLSNHRSNNPPPGIHLSLSRARHPPIHPLLTKHR